LTKAGHQHFEEREEMDVKLDQALEHL